MSLESERDRRLSPEQQRKLRESREQFDLQISNDPVRGKRDASWNFENEQAAKIQTHATFEKYLREELRERGVQMREDDLQKVISVNDPLLRTIGNRIERTGNNPPSFKVTGIFNDPNRPRTISGDDARELAAHYPMGALQLAAEKAMEKTVGEIKQREKSAVDDL